MNGQGSIQQSVTYTDRFVKLLTQHGTSLSKRNSSCHASKLSNTKSVFRVKIWSTFAELDLTTIIYQVCVDGNSRFRIKFYHNEVT